MVWPRVWRAVSIANALETNNWSITSLILIRVGFANDRRPLLAGGSKWQTGRQIWPGCGLRFLINVFKNAPPAGIATSKLTDRCQ
jgi:hypothetical protein